MSEKHSVRETNESYETVSKCSASDFDGHSLFRDFTPTQRLEWLERARADLIELKGLSNQVK